MLSNSMEFGPINAPNTYQYSYTGQIQTDGVEIKSSTTENTCF